MVAGGLLTMALRPSVEPARAQVVDRAVSSSISCTAHLSRADLDALKEEVRTASSAGAHAPAPPAATMPEPAPEPRDDVAYEAASHVLERALAVGTWRQADVDALRPSLAELTPVHQQEIVGHLIAAINSDQLRVAVQGPPL
jgi:hypothetical protein